MYTSIELQSYNAWIQLETYEKNRDDSLLLAAKKRNPNSLAQRAGSCLGSLDDCLPLKRFKGTSDEDVLTCFSWEKRDHPIPTQLWEKTTSSDRSCHTSNVVLLVNQHSNGMQWHIQWIFRCSIEFSVGKTGFPLPVSVDKILYKDRTLKQ